MEFRASLNSKIEIIQEEVYKTVDNIESKIIELEN
jgi:hypothetical protein